MTVEMIYVAVGGVDGGMCMVYVGGGVEWSGRCGRADETLCWKCD